MSCIKTPFLKVQRDRNVNDAVRGMQARRVGTGMCFASLPPPTQGHSTPGTSDTTDVQRLGPGCPTARGATRTVRVWLAGSGATEVGPVVEVRAATDENRPGRTGPGGTGAEALPETVL